MLLTIIVLLPILGSLVLYTFNISEEQSRRISLIVSLITFFLSVCLWLSFDRSLSGYQIIQDYAQISFCHFHIGIDGISLYLVILTTFLTPIAILASWENVSSSIQGFIATQLLIEAGLLLLFTVLDLFLFYVFFEAVLIPLFLLVGIWGASESRVRASLLLFLYTLGGSLFILLAIVTIYTQTGSTDLTTLDLSSIDISIQYWIWLGFILAIAVKTPLVPFHIWLPRAHAEAPLAGSIVLAGTVLKTSTYGIIRLVIPLIPEATSYFSPLIQIIAIISLIYSSLATIRQIDFKALVAYSSISHIAVIILGLFSNDIIGIEGAILLALAHGVISPAIFIIVGGVLYDRYHTRIISYYRGINIYIPILTILFFITSCCNFGVPLSLNWLGEFISLAGIYSQSPYVSIIGCSSILLSACYSIWLWSRISTGSWTPYLTISYDITRREFIILIPLICSAIIFGIFPNLILNDLHNPITNLIYTVLKSPLIILILLLNSVVLQINYYIIAN